MKFSDGKVRCSWIKDDPLYLKYHDEECGVPVYDDNKLFEYLVLELVEAGLNWLVILKKREKHTASLIQKWLLLLKIDKISEFLNNTGIVRSRAKIGVSINNAKRVGDL